MSEEFKELKDIVDHNYATEHLIGYIISEIFSEFGSSKKKYICILNNTQYNTFISNPHAKIRPEGSEFTNKINVYLHKIDLNKGMHNSYGYEMDEVVEMLNKNIGIETYIFNNDWDNPLSYSRENDIFIFTKSKIETEEDLSDLLYFLESEIDIRNKYKYFYYPLRDENLEIYKNLLESKIGYSKYFKKLQELDKTIIRKKENISSLKNDLDNLCKTREEILSKLSDEERLYYETIE